MEEIWKPIIWYEWIYEVSNLGRVKSYKCSTSKILKWTSLKKIYTTFSLLSKRLKAHRLVAQAFLPNPENKPCVCHIKEDLDKNWLLYNWSDNLFWWTYADNSQDMYRKWRENNHFMYKNPNKWKMWSESRYAKAVIQYDLEWNYIKSWWWMREIKREIGIHNSWISKCCRWLIKKYNWFIWKFK